MLFVGVVCGFAGLLIGMIANVRALVFVALLTVPAAFLSGTGGGEGYLIAALWSVTGLVTLQIGYVIAIVMRAIWLPEPSEVRQPASLR
ncbi:MAG TPA: hypothetical protein VH765_05095 [Xanthobacteraceae bacterium]|jgi:hypothetical protein